jgi:RNase P/RNase MRP subunit p29
LKRTALEENIKTIEEKIKAYQEELNQLREELSALDAQEKERRKFVSSKEIVDLIYKKIGKKVNMSTIKRWADEGYLGEVIDEKERFWALQSKQGKKRFVYPKIQAFTFLYEKGFLMPEFEILDRVLILKPDNSQTVGIVVDYHLNKGEFLYTIQIEGSFEILKDMNERDLTIATGDVNKDESKN